MDPLSVTASIITILQLTVKLSEYLGNGKDALTDRSQFATELENISNLLVSLLSRVDESSTEPWHAKARQLGGQDGLVYQYRIALEQLKEKIAEGYGVKKIAKNLLWRHVRVDADRILCRIERLKTVVQIALEMDHFKLSEAMESHVKTVHKISEAIKAGVDALQLNQDLRQHFQVMDWISSDQFQAQQSDLILRRQEETGLWFLGSSKFGEWFQGANPTLFCLGMPGAGKTMMAAITVDHLQKTVQAQDVGIAYIYCNYKARTDQTATNLLAAILKQLVQDRLSLTKSLSSLHDQHTIQKTRPSLDEIIGVLRSVLAHYSMVYIVVDALDECIERNRDELLDSLRNLQSKADFRIMATSRCIPEVVEQFDNIPKLEVRADARDVKRYVLGQIKRLPKCIQRDGELQELVQDKIAEAVDGMFLLAQLHVGSLLDKDTKKKVRKTLNCLHEGTGALTDAYDSVIERIESQLSGKAARAKDVLSWISYAKRQLTTTELCTALAVEAGDKELDEDNVPDIEELVSVCAGLVTVDEQSNIVRLVHYTAQGYLEGIREDWNPSAQYEIASTCLTYLCFDGFRSGCCQSDEDFEARAERNPFLDYSARYWGDHATMVQEEVYGLATRLLKDSSLIACAVQQIYVSKFSYKGYSQVFPRGATALHVTAFLGLVYLCKRVLSRTQDTMALADAKDSYGRTPLSWAADQGHEAVVKMLVEREDVNANSQDSRSLTPLWAAAKGGHEAIAKMLLDHGADVNFTNDIGETLLSRAVWVNHEGAVKILLDNGAKDLALGGFYGNALQVAAHFGFTRILDILLSKNLVMPPPDPCGRTLLWWAAAGGHIATVELLVTRYNFNPQTPNNIGQTPFWIAMSKGHGTVSAFLSGKTDSEQLELPLGDDNAGDYSCDVCTSAIGATIHHHCEQCANED